MLEVGAVDGELIIGVELALQRVVAGPRVTTAALKDVHPVVDGWAIERTEGVNLWWRSV